MTIERLIILIALVLGCSVMAISQDLQFTNVEDLPEARSSLISANDGENIYIVNGFGVSEQYTDEILKYNVSQNTWSILTSATRPKRYASAGIVNNHLYVFNGVMEGGILNNVVEKIDLNDGSIQFLSNHPQPSKAPGVATWNQKIYSFGGSLEVNGYSNKLYEFDPQNDTWTELTEIPFAGETKGEIIAGKLYVIGGFNGTVSNQIDVYNLSTNTWEANFAMPVGISAHATAIVGSKIYLVGDFSNLTSVAYFDTADNSFQVLTNNLDERRHCAAEGVGGSLFAIGGNTQSNIQSSITSVQKADILTATSELSAVELMEAYPNPTADLLNLNQQFDEILLYDIQGKVLRKFTNVSDLDLSFLKSGIYFVKGYIGRDLYQTKFIKI